MDSIDAQCLIVHLAHAEPSPCPDRWEHEPDGGLTARFAGSERRFRWDAEAVAALAMRWRQLGVAVPEPLVELAPGHVAFAALAGEGGLPRPDLIEHDLVSGELTAYYDDSRVAVVIGGDTDERSGPDLPAWSAEAA